MDKERAIGLMREHFGHHNAKWIEHTLKVISYVEKIIDNENITYPFIKDVAILSAIFHDVGIPLSEKKYGNREGKNQEMEGAIIARDLLNKLMVREDIKERVIYIVAHHHTEDAIDGPDFEILWDGDLLTNIEEGRVNMKNYPREKGFRTKSGESLYKEITADSLNLP